MFDGGESTSSPNQDRRMLSRCSSCDVLILSFSLFMSGSNAFNGSSIEDDDGTESLAIVTTTIAILSDLPLLFGLI